MIAQTWDKFEALKIIVIFNYKTLAKISCGDPHQGKRGDYELYFDLKPLQRPF